MKTDKLPKGFMCKCGVWHSFPMYVYAHFREPLTYTCERCNRRYEILLGVAEELT